MAIVTINKVDEAPVFPATDDGPAVDLGAALPAPKIVRDSKRSLPEFEGNE